MRRGPALVVVVVLALGACGSGGHSAGDVVLDGRPRYPDAEGVATHLDRRRIVLDDGRSFRVSPKLQAFSTYTLELEAMVVRRGQYVQVGLDGDTVKWMAGIGAVVRQPPPPHVVYVGRLERIDEERRAVFRDGTVLRLGPDVKPVAPGPAQVEIDVRTHRVRLLLAT